MRLEYIFKFAAFICIVVLVLHLDFRAHALAFGPGATSTNLIREADSSSTITLKEAEQLLDLLPAVQELRAKGMVVKWDSQNATNMNNGDYYFFWIYNVTAQRKRDIGSISVGDYAVNKHTADIRVWEVSPEISFGDDGKLVTTKELARLQEDLRKKHSIDSALIQKYRSAHLASKIIPRASAQDAARKPITDRSQNTAELRCWKDGEHVISRLGRSRVISSSAGYRAYAVVTATAFEPKYEQTYAGLFCENNVKVFLARDTKSGFQVFLDSSTPKDSCVAVDGNDECEINGVHLVDWSENGRFLLAELVLWVYESDAIVFRVPIIYDVMKKEFIRPDVYHFFDEHYKTDRFKKKSDASGSHCGYSLRAEGFSSDGNIIVSALKPAPDPEDEETPCVQAKQTFLFDLRANQIKKLSPDHRVQRYGTWTPAAVSKPRP